MENAGGARVRGSAICATESASAISVIQIRVARCAKARAHAACVAMAKCQVGDE